MTGSVRAVDELAQHSEFIICTNPECNRHIWLTAVQRRMPLHKMACNACHKVLGLNVIADWVDEQESAVG